jgi:hypothetical protein
MNLNNCRSKDIWCLTFFADKGAVFIPFSSRIAAEALKWNAGVLPPGVSNNWYFFDSVYVDLGYELIGDTAVLPPPPNPFAPGRPRPPWSR